MVYLTIRSSRSAECGPRPGQPGGGSSPLGAYESPALAGLSSSWVALDPEPPRRRRDLAGGVGRPHLEPPATPMVDLRLALQEHAEGHAPVRRDAERPAPHPLAALV